MTKEPEIGTLAELNVKPGDVVQGIGGKSWEIIGIDANGDYLIDDSSATRLSKTLSFRIISRASQPAAPKLWRDMTPEEKGALLLAHHEGRAVQEYITSNAGLPGGWFYRSQPAFAESAAYRIRPEPKQETMTLYSADGRAWSSLPATNARWRQTYYLLDGRPDPASIRMEEL